MRLRSRLATTLFVLVIPFAFGVAFYQDHARERAIETTTAEQLVERMDAGERFVCEEFPEQFPRRHGRGRRFGRGGGRAGLHAYDSAFRSKNPSAPAFPADLKTELQRGETVAARSEFGPRGQPQRLIAVRMPWDGDCAVILVRRPGPPEGEGFSAALAPALIISAAAILLVFLAAGPLVGRIRRLTAAVQSGAHPIEVEGSDEVADLSRAFTERQAEIRLRIAEIESRDETLRRFVANTTHDVMIPLTVIQGHLAALRDNDSIDAADRAGLVTRMMEECHYLASLLENLNVAAKLEAGQPHYERHPVDLNGVVERVVARHRPLAAQKGIELNHALPAEPVTLEGDVTLLERALGNLVHNALRYNKGNPPKESESVPSPTGHVAVVLDRTPDGFELSITDDGPGIASDLLSKITQRGFRASEARTRHPDGLGLGLAIVAEIAERHRLALRLVSPPEGGLRAVLTPNHAPEALQPTRD